MGSLNEAGALVDPDALQRLQAQLNACNSLIEPMQTVGSLVVVLGYLGSFVTLSYWMYRPAMRASHAPLLRAITILTAVGTVAGTVGYILSLRACDVEVMYVGIMAFVFASVCGILIFAISELLPSAQLPSTASSPPPHREAHDSGTQHDQ